MGDPLKDLKGTVTFSREKVTVPFKPLLLLLAAMLAACSPELRTDIERPASVAFPASTDTSLGSVAAQAAAAHPGLSGFALIADGAGAFTIRHDLTVLAARAIDVQYYIWEGDTSGRLLAAALAQAAERGVRVRVLIDDIHTKGRDFNILALDAHPNIEVRTFNPFARREARTLNLLTDFARLNHRMHNKMFVVDGAVAILGGRNIGDHYFGLNETVNFRDLDLLAVGPVVSEISGSFDQYWNSPWAFPIAALAGEAPDAGEAAAMRGKLSAWASDLGDFPFRRATTGAEAGEALRSALGPLAWGAATVVYDTPDKLAGSGEEGVMAGLRPEIAELRTELLIESAYFIPTEQGVTNLGALVDRGVRVRVLTNSLATNDLVPGHAGYSRYREDLLRGGVELYEWRPGATAARGGWSPLADSSKASLHTKAMVLDGRKVFVGSFNLNPRSVDLNTEIGVIIESGELARQVTQFMDGGVTPDNAWQLHLATRDGRSSELVWSESAVPPVVRTTEPVVSRWRRFKAWFIAQLPIEKEL